MANGFQSTESAPVSRTGYNGTGATIAQGTAVKLVAAGKYRQVAPVAAVDDVVYGIAAEDIGAAEYGLVYIGGTVPVIASAALTVGGLVTVTTAGKAVDAVSASTILGIAVEVGATDTLAEIELAGPAAGVAP